MWPGSISIASAGMPLGGTALSALLAMGGDLGASIGPSVVGFFTQNANDDMHAGMFAGMIFPIVLTLVLTTIKVLVPVGKRQR